MATVYEAEHTGLHRRVAIKVLDPSLTDRPDFVGRFQREAETIAQLEHPHILPVYDTGEEGDLLYLVMFLARGGTLKNQLRVGDPPPWEPRRVLQLAQQVLPALDVAHREGIVHRDIKPDNILLHGDRAFLADFGIAKLMQGDPGLTVIGTFVGTPDYAAPEQVLALPLDGRSDLYSFGVVLYELLAGQVPYRGETPMGVALQHVQARLPPPDELNPNIPAPLARVLITALAKERDRRYPNGAALVAALENAVIESERNATGERHGPTDRVQGATPVSYPGVEELPDRAEAQRQAEIEAQRLAELEAQRLAELQALREAELEAQHQAELAAQHQAELEAQRQAELEAQHQAELAAQHQAELEAQRSADLEAQRRAELEARQLAELQALRQAELDKQRQLELERQESELEAQHQAELEEQYRVELEQRRLAMLERRRREQEARGEAIAAAAATAAGYVGDDAPSSSPPEPLASGRGVSVRAVPPLILWLSGGLVALVVVVVAVTRLLPQPGANPTPVAQQISTPVSAPTLATTSAPTVSPTSPPVVANAPTAVTAATVVPSTAATAVPSTAPTVAPTTAAPTQVPVAPGPPALATPRYAYASVLLYSGKLLVAGGRQDNNRLGSAEIYDPATNSWSGAANLSSPRTKHTATLLPDGRVLVVGGQEDDSTFLTAAELYDPTTNTWSSAGELGTPRGDHTATLLRDGRVLVIGGANSKEFLASAEVFNPATNDWKQLAAMPNARSQHTATLLPDGRVLVVGGFGAESTAVLYDPAADTWSGAGSMTEPRVRHTATLLPNGKVLVVGGSNSGTAQTQAAFLSSAELYDPSNGIWAPTSKLASARSGHTATLLTNGQVLVAGGNDGAKIIASAERYDPATNAWTAAGVMKVARWLHAARLLVSDQVIVAGGLDGTTALASVESYDPATNAWTTTAP